MPNFGKVSRGNLAEAHPELQRLLNEVIKHYDCSVICGSRTLAQQRMLVAKGASRTLNSRHIPREGEDFCRAVDVITWRATDNPHVSWNDHKSHRFFGGFVKGIASQMGITIRWGGDWDSDNDFRDQSFNDLVHFEINK